MPIFIYSLTENLVFIFLDFKANICYGRWKFSWVFNALQFLLYWTVQVAEMIYLNQCKWYFVTHVGPAVQCFWDSIGKHFLPVPQPSPVRHIFLFEVGDSSIFFGKVITFHWNTETARQCIFSLCPLGSLGRTQRAIASPQWTFTYCITVDDSSHNSCEFAERFFEFWISLYINDATKFPAFDSVINHSHCLNVLVIANLNVSNHSFQHFA